MTRRAALSSPPVRLAGRGRRRRIEIDFSTGANPLAGIRQRDHRAILFNPWKLDGRQVGGGFPPRARRCDDRGTHDGEAQGQQVAIKKAHGRSLLEHKRDQNVRNVLAMTNIATSTIAAAKIFEISGPVNRRPMNDPARSPGILPATKPPAISGGMARPEYSQPLTPAGRPGARYQRSRQVAGLRETPHRPQKNTTPGGKPGVPGSAVSGPERPGTQLTSRPSARNRLRTCHWLGYPFPGSRGDQLLRVGERGGLRLRFRPRAPGP